MKQFYIILAVGGWVWTLAVGVWVVFRLRSLRRAAGASSDPVQKDSSQHV